METTRNKLTRLQEIIRDLRAPDGCPWDKRQTVESFCPYLTEELHELLEAIEHGDPTEIRGEFGDLLFQMVFLGRLYEEQGLFTIDDALETVVEKMIRRHPHVFGDVTINNERELRRQWNSIKAEERKRPEKGSRGLFSFPRSLPALQRAQRVSSRAVGSGFEWPELSMVFEKLDEELQELHSAYRQGSQDAIEEELGDVFFTMVNIARKSGFDAEKTLHKSIEKFTERFHCMADLVIEDDRVFEDLNITEMQEYWSKAKSHLSTT